MRKNPRLAAQNASGFAPNDSAHLHLMTLKTCKSTITADAATWQMQQKLLGHEEESNGSPHPHLLTLKCPEQEVQLYLGFGI